MTGSRIYHHSNRELVASFYQSNHVSIRLGVLNDDWIAISLPRTVFIIFGLCQQQFTIDEINGYYKIIEHFIPKNTIYGYADILGKFQNIFFQNDYVLVSCFHFSHPNPIPDSNRRSQRLPLPCSG